MRQSRGNGLPAYKRIQGAILKRLEAGQLKPGDAVNSERELAKIHRVSLMTARHALAGLEREGMVVRRRGAGTFVAPPKIHFNKLMSYTEQMSGRSLSVSSKLLSLGMIDTEQEIAARLDLPAAGRLIKLERFVRVRTNHSQSRLLSVGGRLRWPDGQTFGSSLAVFHS